MASGGLTPISPDEISDVDEDVTIPNRGSSGGGGGVTPNRGSTPNRGGGGGGEPPSYSDSERAERHRRDLQQQLDELNRMLTRSLETNATLRASLDEQVNARREIERELRILRHDVSRDRNRRASGFYSNMDSDETEYMGLATGRDREREREEEHEREREREREASHRGRAEERVRFVVDDSNPDYTGSGARPRDGSGHRHSSASGRSSSGSRRVASGGAGGGGDGDDDDDDDRRGRRGRDGDGGGGPRSPWSGRRIHSRRDRADTQEDVEFMEGVMGTMEGLMATMKNLDIHFRSAKADPIKIQCPSFQGTHGENPEPHILRAEDWFTTKKVGVGEWSQYFKHTLNGDARLWYDEITVPAHWPTMKEMFRSRYSIQGRSIRHLHERWRQFKFDPATDDIEQFLSDVTQTAKQLGHGDEAVLQLLKSVMPTEMYGTLFPIADVRVCKRMLKEIYVKRPGEVSAPTTAPTPTNPFNVMHMHMRAIPPSSTAQSEKVESESATLLQMVESVEDRLDRLDDRYRKRPWKPQIAPRRGRGRQWDNNRRWNNNRQWNDNRNRRGFQRGNYRQNSRGGGWRNRPRWNNDNNRRNDRRQRRRDDNQRDDRPRSNRFDRSPTKRKPRIAGKPINKDNDRCRYCHEFGHWEAECPKRIRDEAQKRQQDEYRHIGCPEDPDYAGLNEEVIDDSMFGMHEPTDYCVNTNDLN